MLSQINLCIAFGRLSLISPTTVSASMGDVAVPLLAYLGYVDRPAPNTESSQCWRGFLLAIQCNPSLLTTDTSSKTLFAKAVHHALENDGEGGGDVEDDLRQRMLELLT